MIGQRFRALAAMAVALAALTAPQAAWCQASPSDFTTATRYDAERRVTGTIAPDPDGAGPLHYAAVRNSYDPAGRLVKVEKGELTAWPGDIAPANWSSVTTFTVFSQVDTGYDALDRKLKESISSGGTTYQVTQYSYDGFGRLECTAVRMQQAVFGSLPASACSQSVGVSPFDRITRNVYDAAGQLLQVRKGFGTSLEQAYVTYGYTANGKQEFVVDANGNKAQLVYDGHDRQTQWRFPSNGAPPGGYNPSTPANALATSGSVNINDREEYGYDVNGNRTSLRKRDGRTFIYGYDALNRLTSKIVPDACVSGYACTNVAASATRDVFYSYNLQGLQTSARFDGPTGTDAVTSTYDGFGRLGSSTTSMSGVSRVLSYLYDADGNRIQVKHPDGNYFTYAYDGLDRPMDAFESGAYKRLHFDWDAQGRRSAEWRGGVYSSYSYDPVSRLSSLTDDLVGNAHDVTTTFGYNPASQITSRTRSNAAYAFPGYVNANRSYAPNGLNQYTAVAGVSYGYDSNGNLTSDGTYAFTYDAENRLVVTSAGAQLTYDPLGRLYETYKASTGTTRFLYDGDQLTAEYNGSGNLLRRYVHGTGDDDPMLWYEGGDLSALRTLQVDQQGSIVSVADASGAKLAVNAYDEYGIPDGGNIGRFQYTGQAWISELGMYYYKARIYSPTLGRFMQTDPIGYQDQINLYAYVANDPVNGRDPTGTRDCRTDPAACAEAAITAARVATTVSASTALAGTTVVTAPLLLSGDTPKSSEPENFRVYVTYTKKNDSTGETYSGRSSMMIPRGTPMNRELGQRIVDCRECGHHMNVKGFGPARLDRMTTSYDAVRGREQQLINYFGGAKSMGGTSGNPSNGIWVMNPNRPIYLDASNATFGRLANNSTYPTGILPW